MEVNILFLQQNDDIATYYKESLKAEDVFVYVVKNATEAFEMLKEREYLLVIVDSRIPDMTQIDFVRRCSKEYPDMIFNLFMDISEPKFLPAIAGCKNVTRIYLPAWDAEDILEGMNSSIDAARLERDLKRRQQSLTEDMQQFDATLASLKEALMKQRFSYHKLRNVLNPYLETMIKISNEICDEKSVSGETSNIGADSQIRAQYYSFVRKSCEKMLRLMTTSKLEAALLADSIREDFNQNFLEFPQFELKSISNCIAKDTGKDVLAEICFCLWLIMEYQKKRLSSGTISIDSQYITPSVVEYTISAGGEAIECPNCYTRYVQGMLDVFTRGGDMPEEPSATYRIVFEV